MERHKEAGKKLRRAVKHYKTGVALRKANETYPGHGSCRKEDEAALCLMKDVHEKRSTPVGVKYIDYGQTPLS
jgi:hypothetical protein